jgi:uncharacterized protein (TIGR02145 family)
MSDRRKILFSFAVPVLSGTAILFTAINTCQRFEPESILVVTTDSIEILAERQYRLTGTIINIGEEEITQHGFCWAATNDPTTSGTSTQLGAKESKGSFTSTISELTADTKYYVRAYGITNSGTEYGKERSFTTPVPTLPTIATTAVSNVTQESAQSGGTITDDGGVPVTARGVCWKASSEPDILDSKTEDGTGTGIFTSSVTGLDPGTTYYLRAYATNSQGTAYGEERTFATKTAPVTDVDGNLYQTVQIGNQIWMAENLKVTHYANGTSIPLIENAMAWEMLVYTDRAYCWYDNSTTNRDQYGGLYNWPAAMNGAYSSNANPSGVQGVCPDGWHIPSDEEWIELELYLGMSRTEADGTGWRGTDEGGKLKEAGTAHWASNNSGATNESGFTALPGGSRNLSGSFSNIGNYGNWWSSSESTATYARGRYLYFDHAGVYRNIFSKRSGFSVRCVRD